MDLDLGELDLESVRSEVVKSVESVAKSTGSCVLRDDPTSCGKSPLVGLKNLMAPPGSPDRSVSGAWDTEDKIERLPSS